MSKGSKRRKEDFSNIQNNWPEIDWSNKNERRTGDEWSKITGVIIYDPNGWDRTNDSFMTEPIGFEEFLRRKSRSTCISNKKTIDLNYRYNKNNKFANCDNCGKLYKWFDIDKLVWNEEKLVCKDWCLNNKKEQI